MNPNDMLPRLNALFGPELALLLVQMAERHKVSGEWCVRMPSHILVRLLEAACA